MAGKRIDMSHEFMKSIIKNQVDRDKYEKEVQDEKLNLPQKYKDKPGGSTLPEQTSSHGQKSSRANSARKKNMATKKCRRNSGCLFKLEFEDANGMIHYRNVSQSDDAHSLAQQLALECRLSNELQEALEVRLQREFKQQ